jgi:hypothetical protein
MKNFQPNANTTCDIGSYKTLHGLEYESYTCTTLMSYTLLYLFDMKNVNFRTDTLQCSIQNRSILNQLHVEIFTQPTKPTACIFLYTNCKLIRATEDCWSS